MRSGVFHTSYGADMGLRTLPAERVRMLLDPPVMIQSWTDYSDAKGRKLQRTLATLDRKSTRLNSSHSQQSRMPSSA